MSATEITPTVEMHEAPYSWTVRVTGSEGFDEMFTVRAITADGFERRVSALKAQLVEHDYHAAKNGNGHAASEEAPNCLVHNIPMKRRSKDNKSWWSCGEKLSDGSWCQYRPKEKP